MTNRFRNNSAVLGADAKKLKEPTRASPDGRQSVFRKPKGQEKNIPHPHIRRIQAAAAGFVPRLFYPAVGQAAKLFFLNSTNLVD
ncbi:hypothetical protein NL532_08190 [Mesorhizobium sp. C120A]|uniref:hypothetical protein n=1 Tax=unclassified Mesorhizobium TaxID=325217 RepID=UPI0012DBD601|nr:MULTISPECIES: hypothetical protein [unclassified Mesorhizobium]WJI46588.1 hypothetical protein NL532_08190 [Mesorhizobium sp. C120A]